MTDEDGTAACGERPKAECRVTPWVVVEDRPDWSESGIASYRIWQEHDGRHWYQMHEFEFAHGNRERRKTEWINGIRGWLPHAVTTKDSSNDQ